MLSDVERLKLAEQGAGVSELVGEPDEKETAKGGPGEEKESEGKDD